MPNGIGLVKKRVQQLKVSSRTDSEALANLIVFSTRVSKPFALEFEYVDIALRQS